MLKAYTAYNNKVEYCQGMGFPASVMLYYMPEPQAFWCFQQFMSRQGMMYSQKLIGV